MKKYLTRRSLVKLISFSLAIVGVLLASNIMYMTSLTKLSNTVESAYSLAVEELAGSADKLYSALEKSKYSASPEMLSKLSGEVVKESANAKAALLDLPLNMQELSNTEKFLSQVGAYSQYLATLAAKDKLDYEDYLTLEQLCDHAQNLREKLYEIQSQLYSSDKTLSELFDKLEAGDFVVEGVSGIEDTFSEMPKLIYDGPYSDHILEKTPEMTKDANPVSSEAAVRKAAVASGVPEWQFSEASSEDGKMPSYRFTANGVVAAVTKDGGYLSYMLKSRQVSASKISVEEALDIAEDYLESLHIDDMETTYYECYNNVLTVNFAHEEDDIICYTDLIKVTVALDKGEILGFDARGYLVNHHKRSFPVPKLTVEEARGKLSPNLTVMDSETALIPTDSIEERLCYEFHCTTDDGKEVLVYIDTQTGEEADILLILRPTNSVLAV